MTCNERECPFIGICSHYNFLDNSDKECEYEENTYKQLTMYGWNHNPWHRCDENLPPMNVLVLIKEYQNEYFVGKFANKLGNNYYFRESISNDNKRYRNFRQGVEWKYVI
mgnify:FL=1|nr:MAG TPA: hypothetical protein [Bacteriophage sp.]